MLSWWFFKWVVVLFLLLLLLWVLCVWAVTMIQMLGKEAGAAGGRKDGDAQEGREQRR
jgi:hypothetical protein